MNEELTTFLKSYESANNSHIWTNVEPFIGPDATYWLPMAPTQALMKSVKLLKLPLPKSKMKYTKLKTYIGLRSPLLMPFAPTAYWQGAVDGKQSSGAGRGTNVLEKQNGSWQIVHEHLSK